MIDLRCVRNERPIIGKVDKHRHIRAKNHLASVTNANLLVKNCGSKH